jgi:hypothetical protein
MTDTHKDKSLNTSNPAVSGRTVEITDENETIVITFIPVPTNNKEGPR